MAEYDFKRVFADVITYVNDKPKQAIDEWLKWSGRLRLTGGVTFDLTKPCGIESGDIYNEWRGFAVEPKPNFKMSDVVLRHIREVIANNDDELNDYVLDWLAYGVQHYTKPIGVALVLRGEKGSGKSTLGNLMCNIWGRHGAQITSSERLLGRFNEHLIQTPFIFSDEALYAGDRAGEQKLKGLITETSMSCERKGHKVQQVNVAFKVMMATNSDYAVPASRDERRFCVIDVSEERIKDKAYFNVLHGVTGSMDGQAAFLHYLLNREILGDVRKVPETDALKEQRLYSFKPVTKFVAWLAESQTVDLTKFIPRTDLSVLLASWAKDKQLGEYRTPSTIALGKYLDKLKVKRGVNNGVRGRLFESRNKLIKRLEQYEKVKLDELLRDDDDDGMCDLVDDVD